jgi:hypothetical protein
MPTELEFEALVAVVRVWGETGAVDLDLRAVGGTNDGRSRIFRLEGSAATPILVALARTLATAAP